MSVVYFIANDSGAIKIGTTTSLAARFAALQTASAVPLRLLGVVDGDIKVERQLQIQFGHLLISGEWFRTDPALDAWIVAHAKPGNLVEVTRIRSPSVVADEAVELIAAICGEENFPYMVKQMLWKVSSITGITERRLRGMWNREAGIIRAEEMDCLRETAGHAAPHRFITSEQRKNLIDRIAFLENRLAEKDPEFFSSHPHPRRDGVNVAGRAHRPMASGR